VKLAALAVVPGDGGRLLTVSRPRPPYEMSIPGGRVEPGETPQRAALRELYEETNVVGDSARLVWAARSPTDGRTVYVLLVPCWHGVACAREGGAVGWLTPRQLIAQAVVYGAFARDMFRALPLLVQSPCPTR